MDIAEGGSSGANESEARLSIRQDLPAPELLEHASGGTSLKGIYYDGKTLDLCKIAIVAPSDIQLRGSILNRTDYTFEFSSRSQNEEFNSTLKTLGYGAAVEVHGGNSLFKVKANYENKHKEEEKQQECSKLKEVFQSIVKIEVIPIKSIEFEKDKLRLSNSAITELKLIDSYLGKNTDKKSLESASNGFLKTYGSHIYTGEIHFGGILQSSAEYSSKSSSNTLKSKSLVKDFHTASLSAEYTGKIFNAGGTVSGDYFKDNEEIKNKYEESERKNVQLKLTRNGGPYEATSLQQWTEGLRYNESWSVIDRGIKGKTVPDQLTGIWDVVQNHSGEFENLLLLSELLRETWSKMSGIKMSNLYTNINLLQIDDQKRRIVTDVENWLTEENLSQRAVTYLKKLYSVCSNNQEFWIDVLENENCVGIFFSKITKFENEYREEEIQILKHYLKKFLNLAKHAKFENKDELYIWAFESNVSDLCTNNILTLTDIKDIDLFLSAIKNTLLPAIYTKLAKQKNENIADETPINIILTKELAAAARRVRKFLVETNDVLLLFFFETLMSQLRYNTESELFHSQVSIPKLESFLNNFKEELLKYKQYKAAGDIPLQAYLICLTEGRLCNQYTEKEKHFTNIIQDIKPVLKSDLKSIVSRYASDSPYDWEELFFACGKLRDGEQFQLPPKCIMIQGIENPNTAQLIKEEKSESEINDRNILETFGLEKFYPGKITVQDAMKIKNQNPNPKTIFDVPWVILRKLLMVNYHARDTVLSDFYDRDHSFETDDNGITDDISDDFFAMLENDQEKNYSERFHPMDLLITTLGCCDMMLKQILVKKLLQCGLAIPLIYPALEKDTYIYSLWAFRTLGIEWTNERKISLKTNIAKHEIRTISFFRYGSTIKTSKSKNINHIMTSRNVDTFFNKYSPLGHSNRRVANGMVEASWYIPSNQQTDDFKELLMFLNLRGDSYNYKNQVSLMSEMASICVVFVNVQHLCEEGFLTFMGILYKNSPKIIIFLDGIDNKDKAKCQFEEYNRYINEKFGRAGIENTKWIFNKNDKNYDDSKKEFRKKIKLHLESLKKDDCTQVNDGKNKRSVSGWSKVAKKYGFHLDEEHSQIVNGKVLSKSLIELIDSKKSKLNTFKAEMLPLQALWKEYSDLLIESNRSRCLEDTFATKQKMTKKRNQQVKCLQKLSPVMSEFINILNNSTTDLGNVIASLQWLKIHLDDISRDVIPVLKKKYNEIHDKLMANGQTHNNDLKKELLDAEFLLSKSSFGLEHCFREIGQIYEATIESTLDMEEQFRKTVEHFPKIIAKILLKGYPLELMDGDAACVPLTWIKAVFDSVITTVGDKRVFVVSVLGIQSSGKSTMLNTMFGVQFAVSAGRCTRGVFLQIVEVDEASGLPFDLLFIIDTEGLRAPELGIENFIHDNKLGTFVAGLGDVTLINIKGENLTEVQDVLQIVVHAFLRMKLVNANISLGKRCFFVHQNVFEICDYGTRKLVESLNTMTKEAAAQENKANVNTFNDVIQFNEKNHVWCISNLFEGDPPMAPINPGYSNKILDIKECLVYEISKDQNSFHSISETIMRLNDLWDAVTAEDFVFNYKNSLTVKAYKELEDKFVELLGDMENGILDWLRGTARIKIEGANNILNLEKIYSDLVLELQSKIAEETDEIKEQLKRFISENPLSNILIQWQSQKIVSVTNKGHEIIDVQMVELKLIEESRKHELQHGDNLERQKRDILQRSKNMAEQLKGKDVSDKHLKDQFDSMWKNWLSGYTAKEHRVPEDIVKIVSIALYDEFPSDGMTVRLELKDGRLCTPFSPNFLEGSLSRNMINSNHYSVVGIYENFKKKVNTDAPKPVKKTVNIVIDTDQGKYEHEAVRLGNDFFRQLDIQLEDLKKRDSNFQKLDASNLIRIIIEKVKHHNKKSFAEVEITLSPSFTVMISVLMCRHAIPIFKKIRKNYEVKHSIERRLQSYRKMAENMFINLVKQKSKEIIAADLLCDKLEEVIQSTVKNAIDARIPGDISDIFCRTKFGLIKDILTDLSLKGSFTNYESYLRDPKSFSLQWLTKFTNDHLFRDSEMIHFQYHKRAQVKVRQIFIILEEGIEQATRSVMRSDNATVSQWLEKFRTVVRGHMPLNNSLLREFESQSVEDFINLQSLILERFSEIESSINNSFTQLTEETIMWSGNKTPYQEALDRVWGCSNLCPFCEEICMNTDPHHASDNDCHKCVQHKPQGIGAVRVKDTKKLLVGSCNFMIQSNWVHYYPSLNGDKAPYKDYKTYYPLWDIYPSSKDEENKYWNWFMSKYKAELAVMYNCNAPDIPDHWTEITREEAVKSLSTIY